MVKSKGGEFKMKEFLNKKGLSLLMLLLVFLISGALFSACSKSETSVESFEAYKDKWQKKDYVAMYNMLSSKTKEKVNEKQFVDRYTAIYNGIEAANITINTAELDKSKVEKGDTAKIPFSITMDTLAGSVEIKDYEMTLIKEKVDKKSHWRVEWSEKLIFPEMTEGDKVRAEAHNAKRGEIYDRNGKPLAVNAPIVSLGVHPSKFNNNKEAKIAELAKILDITPKFIEDKLKANKDPEMFVPIVNLLTSAQDKITAAMKIEGVIHAKPIARVYPGGEAFGSLIGNVGSITQEELEKLKGQGYTSTSIIGKRGLEQVLDKRLKGENGGIIYISKQKDGKEMEKITIAKKDSKDGENVKLTVDFDLQQKIYTELNKEPGSASALNPKTGEVLALVSSPSFDSNLFTTYIPESVKAQWEKSNNAEFNNRFKVSYAPGSTFKMITGAIGLDKDAIKLEDTINVQGKEWQKDSSWGKYKVTRVTDPGKPVNIKDAFIYSDNIYFAQAALNIGKDDFAKESSKFGLNEELPFVYPMAKAQISNDGKIKNDIQLADSGYGQGEVLMTPLHVSLAYSAVVNDGNIMTPILEAGESKVWKENAISKDSVKLLQEYLKAVIENPSGTGREAQIPGKSLAGKTGTAELKRSMEDTNAEENGWFVVMNTDNPKIVLTMMMENVKTRGGSHYVVPRAKKVMEQYLK